MIYEKLQQIIQEEQQRYTRLRCRLFLCASTGCVSSGCQLVKQAVEDALQQHHIAEYVDITPTGCMGLCSRGPLLRVESPHQPPVLFASLQPLVARLIVSEYIIPIVQQKDPRQVVEVPEFLQQFILDLNTPFFTRQKKVVLANSGRINPERIEDYIVNKGYSAFLNVLTTMSPEQVIDEIIKSGLRGRGGGGYPTGLKWQHVRKAKGSEKFIICNGDEGDPGAYMDRCILEGDPHAVIEGMLIAGYATGATSGWFYIRAEYPLAIIRVEKAIRQARKLGLLGKNILGTSFSFDCEVRFGAGAFVCGEETALIASIEGKRGTPRPRPPYPSIKGLWDQPTCVNNVETLANVPSILRMGSTWFASMGTATSKGTKVFALTGKIKNSGLIEVPMGITLREIVDEMAGGSSTGKPIKAIQTGGPSGGVIPASAFDTPVGYEELKKLGSMMGSGGMIVMDEDDSMVDIAAFYLDFTVDESCGKCSPCRIGGKQLLTLLRKIQQGEGTQKDLALVRRLGHAMQTASLCGLGQTAPNPVLSTLKYFEQEYLSKLKG